MSNNKEQINPQENFAAAVVIPTVLRPMLLRAVRSVFTQDLDKPIQILIGIDKQIGDISLINDLYEQCPNNRFITVVNPGYSTSVRHGGVHSNRFSGSMRTVLSFLANSRFVAYLDDDNWYSPSHISDLLKTIEGHDWAFSKRWYAHPSETLPLCVDEWESVGPGLGVYAQNFGGFMDTSTLMLDKLNCANVLHSWSQALGPGGDGEDRILFKALQASNLKGRGTNSATSFYTLDPNDGNHEFRRQMMAKVGVHLDSGLQSPDGRYLSRPQTKLTEAEFDGRGAAIQKPTFLSQQPKTITYPDGLLAMNNYEFTNDWFQTRAMNNWDQLIPQLQPLKILEIGSYEGASACYLIDKLACEHEIELHCVDTWEGGVEHKEGGVAQTDMGVVEARFRKNIGAAIANAKNKVNLALHKGYSDVVLAKLIASGMAGYFDFIYIDGSHQAPDVLCDAVLGFKLLKVNGLIAFDDYLWSEFLPHATDPIRCPKPAIDAFVNINIRKINIVSAPLYQLYVQKISD